MSGDPLADFDRYEWRKEDELKKRPVCTECGEHIQDDVAYYFGGTWVCEECMNRHRRYIEE